MRTSAFIMVVLTEITQMLMLMFVWNEANAFLRTLVLMILILSVYPKCYTQGIEWNQSIFNDTVQTFMTYWNWLSW